MNQREKKSLIFYSCLTLGAMLFLGVMLLIASKP